MSASDVLGFDWRLLGFAPSKPLNAAATTHVQLLDTVSSKVQKASLVTTRDGTFSNPLHTTISIIQSSKHRTGFFSPVRNGKSIQARKQYTLSDQNRLDKLSKFENNESIKVTSTSLSFSRNMSGGTPTGMPQSTTARTSLGSSNDIIDQEGEHFLLFTRVLMNWVLCLCGFRCNVAYLLIIS